MPSATRLRSSERVKPAQAVPPPPPAPASLEKGADGQVLLELPGGGGDSQLPAPPHSTSSLPSRQAAGLGVSRHPHLAPTCVSRRERCTVAHLILHI